MPETVEEALTRDRFAAANGIELLEVRPGSARARLVLQERHRNSVGLAHGGAIFTLAAFAFFAACNAAGRLGLGIAMSIQCTKAASEGVLTAEATEMSRSRRLATNEVRVTDESGELVALFTGTAYLKEEPFPPRD